jgi:tetrahydromethanopterin S-methyltransferase subunit B
MTMPKDSEHEEILKYYNGPSTDKMKAIATKVMSEAEERILKQNVRPIVEKVNEHDNIFADLGRSFSAGFGIITSVAGKVTGKKKST